jgi:hypothetical protein
VFERGDSGGWRDLPGRGPLRTSVGAWNDDSDSERLLAGALTPPDSG